tara:strand:- start:918 stop:2270 length:1353 start_codon:yes stop_codon:yes gene_type:complete
MQNNKEQQETNQNGHVEVLARPSSNSSRVVVFGMVVVLLIFGGLGIWAGTAPLAKAVAAFATLTVKGDRKKIQHLEGGIVASLHVSEGQLVKKGELLVALDPLQATAMVGRHNKHLDQVLAREARLESELRDDPAITLTGLLLEKLAKDPSVRQILETEEKHFIARRDTFDGHIAILTQRIEQLNNEIKGLELQRSARIRQHEIFQEEIIGLRELYEKGYYPRSKVLAMERAIVELKGAAGNDTALIARAESAQGEARNQIVSVRQRFREDIVKQLRDVKVEINDLKLRLLAAEDVLERQQIRAPRSGIVQGIQLHTIGGVVQPGSILMEIAPQDDDLQVKAKILTTDIDSVAIGQEAEVRLTALNLRKTPAIFGSVVSISGDSLEDPGTYMPYFLAIIEISPEERHKLGDVRLTAGMPAEVLIQTGERTALNYILKPFIDALSRGLNEE